MPGLAERFARYDAQEKLQWSLERARDDGTFGNSRDPDRYRAAYRKKFYSDPPPELETNYFQSRGVYDIARTAMDNDEVDGLSRLEMDGNRRQQIDEAITHISSQRGDLKSKSFLTKWGTMGGRSTAPMVGRAADWLGDLPSKIERTIAGGLYDAHIQVLGHAAELAGGSRGMHRSDSPQMFQNPSYSRALESKEEDRLERRRMERESAAAEEAGQPVFRGDEGFIEKTALHSGAVVPQVAGAAAVLATTKNPAAVAAIFYPQMEQEVKDGLMKQGWGLEKAEGAATVTAGVMSAIEGLYTPGGKALSGSTKRLLRESIKKKVAKGFLEAGLEGGKELGEEGAQALSKAVMLDAFSEVFGVKYNSMDDLEQDFAGLKEAGPAIFLTSAIMGGAGNLSSSKQLREAREEQRERIKMSRRSKGEGRNQALFQIISNAEGLIAATPHGEQLKMRGAIQAADGDLTRSQFKKVFGFPAPVGGKDARARYTEYATDVLDRKIAEGQQQIAAADEAHAQSLQAQEQVAEGAVSGEPDPQYGVQISPEERAEIEAQIAAEAMPYEQQAAAQAEVAPPVAQVAEQVVAPAAEEEVVPVAPEAEPQKFGPDFKTTEPDAAVEIKDPPISEMRVVDLEGELRARGIKGFSGKRKPVLAEMVKKARSGESLEAPVARVAPESTNAAGMTHADFMAEFEKNAPELMKRFPQRAAEIALDAATGKGVFQKYDPTRPMMGWLVYTVRGKESNAERRARKTQGANVDVKDVAATKEEAYEEAHQEAIELEEAGAQLNSIFEEGGITQQIRGEIHKLSDKYQGQELIDKILERLSPDSHQLFLRFIEEGTGANQMRLDLGLFAGLSKGPIRSKLSRKSVDPEEYRADHSNPRFANRAVDGKKADVPTLLQRLWGWLGDGWGKMKVHEHLKREDRGVAKTLVSRIQNTAPIAAQDVAQFAYTNVQDLDQTASIIHGEVLLLRDLIRGIKNGEKSRFGYGPGEAQARLDFIMKKYGDMAQVFGDADHEGALARTTRRRTKFLKRIVAEGGLHKDVLKDVDSYWHRMVDKFHIEKLEAARKLKKLVGIAQRQRVEKGAGPRKLRWFSNEAGLHQVSEADDSLANISKVGKKWVATTGTSESLGPFTKLSEAKAAVEEWADTLPARIESEEYDYNTDYMQAEVAWLFHLEHQSRLGKIMSEIDRVYGDEGRALKGKYGNDYAGLKKFVNESADLDWYVAGPGSLFFKASTPEMLALEQVAEDEKRGMTKEEAEVMDAVLRDMAETTSLSTSPDAAVQRALAQAYILPTDIVAQLNEMVKPRQISWVGRTVSLPFTQWWARNILTSLPKFAAYNARNAGSDLSALLPVAPGALKEVGFMGLGGRQTRRVLKNFHGRVTDYKGSGKGADGKPFWTAQDHADKKIYDEVKGLDMLQTGELGQFAMRDIASIETTEAFDRAIKRKLSARGARWVKRAWSGFGRDMSMARENRLRVGLYLHYKKKLEAGTVKHYGASRKADILEIVDKMGVEEAAAVMSHDLAGDYRRVSVMGEWLRNNTHPFFAFMDMATRRQLRMMQNTAQAEGIYWKIMPVMTVAIGHMLLNQWNRFWDEDFEDKGPDYDQDSPHALIPIWPGKRIVLGQISVHAEMANWLGLWEMFSRRDELLKGQISMGDFGKHMLKSFGTRMVSGVGPTIKTPFEVAAGVSAFPDPFNPRDAPRLDLAVYGVVPFGKTAYQKVVKEGMEPGYRASEDWPARLMGFRLAKVQNHDYYAIREKIAKFRAELKGAEPPERGSGLPGETSKMRKAVMRQDFEAFLEVYEVLMEKHKGNQAAAWKAYKRSMPVLNLTGRMPAADVAKFEAQLTERQAQQLQSGRAWARETRILMEKYWRRAYEESQP